MKNEERWNAFLQSGKVSDYLNYVGVGERNDSRTGNRTGKEREQREGASEGHGSVSGYHW